MGCPKIMLYAFPIVIEFTGIIIITIGIAVELSTNADFAHIIITSGSLIIALGGIIWSKLFKIFRKHPKD